MAPVRPLLAAAALATLLAGCGETRPLAAPFTGTWHQVAGKGAGSTPEDTRSVGFVAFGSERVTVSLPDGERGVLAIAENLSDPGLRAGRLRLEDGSELFLCAGQGYVDLPLEDGRLLAPSAWLDVRWIRRDGRDTNLRLWSGDALAAADLARRAPPRRVASAPTPPAPAAAPIAGETAGDPRDRRFTDSATGDRFLSLAARELVAARGDGLDDAGLAGIYSRVSLTVRGELLALLEAAGEGRAVALADADRLRSGLERFDQAFRTWLPERR